mgnify:CR=1 FL=1
MKSLMITKYGSLDSSLEIQDVSKPILDELSKINERKFSTLDTHKLLDLRSTSSFRIIIIQL